MPAAMPRPTSRDAEAVGLKGKTDWSQLEAARRAQGAAPAPSQEQINQSAEAMMAEMRREEEEFQRQYLAKQQAYNEKYGAKFAPAAGNWCIEVDGQVIFDFGPEDEAEARLAYNQIKRKEPDRKVVLKRDKEAGGADSGKSRPTAKSDLPSDRIKPAKAKEMLKNPPHGKPLSPAQERMLQAASHKNDKAAGPDSEENNNTVRGGGPQGNAYARFNQPQNSLSPAEQADEEAQNAAVDEAYRNSGGKVWKITKPGVAPEYSVSDEYAMQLQEKGFPVEEVTDIYKARAAANTKATVQTPQGTAVGVKPGNATSNLPAAPVQPATSEAPSGSLPQPDNAELNQPQPGMNPADSSNEEGKSAIADSVYRNDDTGWWEVVTDSGDVHPESKEHRTEEEARKQLASLQSSRPTSGNVGTSYSPYGGRKAAPAGESMPAREQKATPASAYLQTLKETAEAVRANPKDAKDLYHGADEAQAKVQEWVEAKEDDLAAFALERWTESFDPEILEKAESDGILDRWKESLHDLMTELSDAVSESDHAFEAVTNSAGSEDGIDEDDWAEYIVAQDSLERFLQEFPRKYEALQEEFYQEIGEHQVAKQDEENQAWEEEVDDAVEELESIEDPAQASQRADEINEQFRQDGNQYRLVFEGNEWRYNDVETLQEEGYDVKGRRPRSRKSGIAGSARSHRAAVRKASPTNFIGTLNTMIEDAGTPAAHQAVDQGFNEAEQFIDKHGKDTVAAKVREWQRQFGKEAVERADDAVGHFKDDVKQALEEIRTAMEVAVNSYKATSAAGTSGDMAAVEDATGDYEASASELQDLMEQFDQRVEAAAASCERAIMAGRGQIAYESVTEKSGARKRKRDYATEYAEIRKTLPARQQKGAAPAGATFPAGRIVSAADRREQGQGGIVAATTRIYAVAKKSPCCGKGGCDCGCNNGRCYAIKYAPGMEALDSDAQKVMDKMEGPRGIKLNRGEMSASCILATSGQDREGDIIDIAGVDFSIHQGNPVAMLDHGVYYPLPIGLCRNPTTGKYLVQKNEQAQEITETTYFSQRSEMAEQVYALIDEGIINANSIGFDPIETTPINGRSSRGKEGPKIVHKAALIEVTWTPLPVNPEAVRAALAKNVQGRPMAAAIKSMLATRVPEAFVRRHWERSGVADSQKGRSAERVERLKDLTPTDILEPFESRFDDVHERLVDNPHEVDPEEVSQLLAEVAQAAGINERDQEILTRRANGESFKSIGDSLNISRARVKQIEEESLAKLRMQESIWNDVIIPMQEAGKEEWRGQTERGETGRITDSGIYPDSDLDAGQLRIKEQADKLLRESGAEV